MKKTFTKLFSVIMIILFSSLGVKSQNVEIGYGASKAWPV